MTMITVNNKRYTKRQNAHLKKAHDNKPPQTNKQTHTRAHKWHILKVLRMQTKKKSEANGILGKRHDYQTTSQANGMPNGMGGKRHPKHTPYQTARQTPRQTARQIAHKRLDKRHAKRRHAHLTSSRRQTARQANGSLLYCDYILPTYTACHTQACPSVQAGGTFPCQAAASASHPLRHHWRSRRCRFRFRFRCRCRCRLRDRSRRCACETGRGGCRVRASS
mmetsp:Transcript_5303/g.10345  ORF Transcript_5303/g.10345 Transcript_5303/m.10345 type:complete len:222 (+) Transcript_5303:68-733(+)